MDYTAVESRRFSREVSGETMKVDAGTAVRFGLDVEGIRRGLYSDQYFNNGCRILHHLAREGFRYRGSAPAAELGKMDLSDVAVGDMEVDMQIFTRREPFSILAGMKPALAVIASCAGFFDESGEFVSTAGRLRVRAVPDGTRLLPWEPAMRIEGRYRDFGFLETVILGLLTRSTLVATNTYRMLEATGGRPVFFFPARFDIYHNQAFDGLAYKVGVDAYNCERRADTPVLVSTDAQGVLWGGRGGGTVSHSYLLCFLKDTAEAMINFARVMPADVKRIALVDVNNDCVGDSRAVALAMFDRYRQCLEEQGSDEAEKFVLFGVRLDTSGEVRDVSVIPTGDKRMDNGVCPRLVRQVREALDRLADHPSIDPEQREQAGRYFRNIKILVSGGFEPNRAAMFRDMGVPADMYGVGSWFFRGGENDFTADVVRVRIGDQWVDLAKIGRRPFDKQDLREVEIAE